MPEPTTDVLAQRRAAFLEVMNAIDHYAATFTPESQRLARKAVERVLSQAEAHSEHHREFESLMQQWCEGGCDRAASLNENPTACAKLEEALERNISASLRVRHLLEGRTP